MNWATIRDCRGKLAQETGTILKDWGGRIHVALIYPNRYSVGMSNLGLQTIYGLANSFDQVVFERVFFEGHEPASLESQRPLSDFDVFAFSFSYEHDYFNAVQLLKSSGIPLFSRDRDMRHPLVIAGGAAVTANPEPVAQFIDCFAIGEAEAILPRMIDIFSVGLELSREQLLEDLSLVPGVYVPAFGDQTVIRQVAKDIDDFPTTSVVLNPQTELGDMYLIETARGCARGCRFCLAGYQFRPARFRPVESLLAQAEEGLRYHNRVGLVSAAISDHPQIEDLIKGLRGMGADFSVSSIRIDPLPEILLQGLARSGAKTLTLAPEAGSQRLRNVVGKGISEDDIFSAVSRVAAYNFKQIKLYFMIGLPSETDSDIVAIAHLVQSAKAVADRSRSGIHFTLNITPFVPKAGTPFQWMPMARKTVLKKRLAMLKKELRQQGVEVKADSIEWSLIQGMLARGDARLGTVIANMSKVNLSAWWQVLEKSGIDSDAIHQPMPLEERLPWERINSGTSRDRLQGELQKVILNEY